MCYFYFVLIELSHKTRFDLNREKEPKENRAVRVKQLKRMKQMKPKSNLPKGTQDTIFIYSRFKNIYSFIPIPNSMSQGWRCYM